MAASGGRVVLPDQWANINLAAEEIDRQTCRLNGHFDTLPIAQAVAGEMLSAFRRADPIEYDCRWCPEFELDSRIGTLDRYYALVHGSTTLVPLRDWDQWEQVADDAFPDPECNAHIDADCYRAMDRASTARRNGEPVEKVYAEPIAVARGEFICIFCICRVCLQGLYSLTLSDWPEYSGPGLWFDTGPAWFDPSDPTVMKDMGIQFSNDPDIWGV